MVCDCGIHRVWGCCLLSAALGGCGGVEPAAEEPGAAQSALLDKVFTDASGDAKIQVRTCSVERDGSGVDPTGNEYLLLGGGADEAP